MPPMNLTLHFMSILRPAILLATMCTLGWLYATAVHAQESATTDYEYSSGISTFEPLRTDSPRETLNSFVRLTWILESVLQAYQAEQTREHYNRIQLLGPRFLQLLDLREVPGASQREVGRDTSVYLLDIIGRLNLPKSEDIPGETSFKDDEPAKWRIPGTPVRIVRIDEGTREGEFLFSGRTVEIVPWLY
ncbi:MAG: hypothetical protein GQ563_05415, partial [Desulfuromusa sp.]|nr:hypothetical protein [Desulfuromusa sp.]